MQQLSAFLTWAPIVVLFFVGCPTAVVGLVVAVVVYSFQRHAGRSSSHIVYECRKGIPRMAYGNPSTSISRICTSRGVSAALSHLFPSAILRHIKKRGALPARRNAFSLSASAGFCISANQVVMPNNLNSAAIANTFPRAASYPCQPNGDEIPKPFPGYVTDAAISRVHSHTGDYKPQFNGGLCRQ